MAIEVATAYMPVVPSMRGLKRQLSATAVPAATAVGSQMSTTMSSRISSGLKTGLKTGVKVGAAGIGAVLGTALVKGFGRLSAIENAEAKLTGLGNSASDTAKIMDNALAAVKGTAFGMDEAATTAASAVAAGVAPGQELEKYLGLVGDAATIAGTDMASMGSIFNKVMTSGKVQGDVFAQLSDSGIPVVQMLAEEMGVSAEQVYELGSKGEISSEQFLAAMGSMEGAAKEGGKTTTGAFKNMMAALSRFGAGMLKGVFPLIGPLFNGITSFIDKAEAVVTPFAESVSTKLGGALKTAGAAAVRFVTPLKDIGNLDVLTPEIVSRMGLSEDSPMGRGMNALIGGIRAFRASWTAFDGDVTSSGFPGFMERAAFSIRSIWESLRNIDFSSWDSFKSSLGDSGSTIMEQFQSIGDSLVTLRPAISEFISSLPKIGGAVGTLAVAGIGLLADTLSFLANHVDTIIRFMPLIVAGFVAWKVASVGLAASQQKLLWAQTAMAPVLLANNALRLTNNLLEASATKKSIANTTATAANTTATASNNVAQNTGVLARGRAVIATVAHKAATIAQTVATKAATIAQRALNLAMRMNPIGLVIMGLVALGAAVVLMYNRVGWFKDGVQAAWAGIKAAAAGVADWFMSHVWPTITNVLQWIGAKFVWLYQNAVVPAWNWIKGVISGFVTWFTTSALPWIQNALRVMGQVFVWLWQNVVKPVWNGILVAITIAIAAVRLIVQGLVWFFRTVLAPVFTWLYSNVIKPVFGWIVAAAQAWWAGLQVYFNLAKAIIQNVVAPVVMWLWRTVFGPAFRGIGIIVQSAWANVIRPSFEAIKQGATWVGDRFSALRVRVNNIWQQLKLLLYVGAVYIKKYVFDPLKQGASWLGDRFSSVRNRIGEIWQNLRTRLYNGYVYIRDRALNPLRTAAKAVQTTFENVKNGIKTAWDLLKSAVKKPIKFVVDSVVNPFIGAYNKANDFWSGDDMKKIELGFNRGGVISGYEPRKRDDRMIPMRSGEGVLVPEVVRGLGAGFVHAANRLGNSGGVQAVRAWAEQGFAKGGVVGSPLKGNHRISQYPNAGHLWAVDIATPTGTPLYATADGTVTWAGPGVRAPGVWGGNEIHISGGGLERWFAHLSQISVRKGQQVKKGDRIGSTGNTGISSGPHLHFGVFKGGYPHAVNALDYLGGAFKFDPNAPVGGGGSSWTDPIQWVKDKITGIFDFENPLKSAQDKFSGNKFLQLGTGIFGKLKDGVIEKAASLADPIINAVDAVKESGVGKRVAEKGNQVKVEAWVLEALKATGQMGVRRFNKTVEQVYIESGGDPNAENNTAAGKQAGSPKGLLQTIPSTFNAYKMPGKGNIFDPVHNAIAAIRHVLDKYGSIENIWPTKAGYARGGVVDDKWDDPVGTVHALRPGVSTIYNGTGTTEMFQRVEKAPAQQPQDGEDLIEAMVAALGQWQPVVQIGQRQFYGEMVAATQKFGGR